MSDDKSTINPNDLPQKDVFKRKEVFQHPQPADTGKPLNKDEKSPENEPDSKKESDKTSKEDGLNESRSAGAAGPFEGFEEAPPAV